MADDRDTQRRREIARDFAGGNEQIQAHLEEALQRYRARQEDGLQAEIAEFLQRHEGEEVEEFIQHNIDHLNYAGRPEQRHQMGLPEMGQQAERIDLEATIRALEVRLGRAEIERDHLAARNRALEDRLGRAEAVRDRLTARNVELEARLEEAEVERVRLAARNEDQDARIRALEQEINERLQDFRQVFEMIWRENQGVIHEQLEAEEERRRANVANNLSLDTVMETLLSSAGRRMAELDGREVANALEIPPNDVIARQITETGVQWAELAHRNPEVRGLLEATIRRYRNN